MSKRVFILAHATARRLAVAHILNDAPPGSRVTVDEEPKSREQEQKYHAMLGDISRQFEHAGRKWDEEKTKRILVSAFREDTKNDPELKAEWEKFGEWELVPGLRGEFVVVGLQTREFRKKLATAFIEWLYAFGAESGIQWSDEGAQLRRNWRDAGMAMEVMGT